MTITSQASTLLLMCIARALPSPAPLACNMKALNPVERQRHAEQTRGLLAAVTDRREIDDGYAYSLDPAKVSVIEVAEWITLEHRCCPFFRFQMNLGESGSTTLALSGPRGVKQFIDAEMVH